MSDDRGLLPIDGVRVGHWTGRGTGVTVVLLPPGTTASGEVRGGAPATREIELLRPGRSVECVDAVVLSGGSAFGLAAADGVMQHLAELGRGFPTRGGPVPIVCAASIYDLVVAGDERPDAAAGRAAAEAAERGEPARSGRVGAGRGATVGKWRGPDHAVPGGLGGASAPAGAATVAALAVVNAIGDVVDADGTVRAGSSAPPDVPPFPDLAPFEAEGNTTLVVVVTDARCTKEDCHLVAQSAHHGLARAVHPSHTRHDGDLVIAAATGSVEVNVDHLRMVAGEVTAAAVRAAVAGGA